MNLDDKDKHVRTKGRTRKGSIELKEGYGKQVLESVIFLQTAKDHFRLAGQSSLTRELSSINKIMEL